MQKNDFQELSTLIGKYEILLFDCEPVDACDDVFNSFYHQAEAIAGRDAGVNLQGNGLYTDMKERSANFSRIVVGIMLFMSAVICIAAVIMIRFRIAGDIKDQIQSIGVLEALGYTSRDISFSYTMRSACWPEPVAVWR